MWKKKVENDREKMKKGEKRNIEIDENMHLIATLVVVELVTRLYVVTRNAGSNHGSHTIFCSLSCVYAGACAG